MASHRNSETTLSMKIYSALLGNRPRIHKDERQRRLHADDTPFHAPTLGRQLRRATGQATRALDEARERLNRSKPQVKETNNAPATTMVLIGRSAKTAQRRKAAAPKAA